MILTLSLATIGSAATVSGENGIHWGRLRPAVTLQSGFARTFQLNLGGAFGKGPGWQTRLVLEFPGVIARGDGLTLNGWMTVDTPGGRRDWIAGVAYRAPARRIGGGTLSLTAGWQRWLFPSVLGGVSDHLVALNGSYRIPWKAPITFTADQWVNVRSAHKKGSLTLIQATLAHQLVEGHGVKLVLRHGPSSSYSYQFWDRPGWRVFRYAGSLSLESKSYTLEGAVREQAGVAPRVPQFTYWSVLFSRRL
ncbi:MAG TPA: hypothetical protein VLH09_15400 [Bryobacteraceae bacterium]|nr:hypothetical protein [Bryobacteraceae bacterium]